ncbi:MAG TPA: RnfABCDGE type electron transport complex subunit D [Chitinispirillaceae bacterium]|nr:RnfABCDGE type electron transport complex subunit D [Chitinispirillaceae bacterium]
MITQTATKTEIGENKQVTNIEPSQSQLNLSSSPHIRHPQSVSNIMLWVVIALVPAFIGSFLFFGWRAIFLTCVSVTFAVTTEYLIVHLTKKPKTIGNFSAVITGILLAFNVSPTLPWWMLAIGSVFAVGVAKMAFGGLGSNFINPALAGRAFLMASYPAAMTSWVAPQGIISGTLSGFDGLTSATPLALFKNAEITGTLQNLNIQDSLLNLFIGNVGGCIGETSALALLIGALILWQRRIIGFRIPVIYIGTVFFLFWLFNGTGNHFTSAAAFIPLYQILSGGLFLGAIFMATDMVTSPITPAGKLYFALGCGLLTFIIRKFGGYPEGVSYSILIMNLFVPLIERYTRPPVYGKVKKRG